MFDNDTQSNLECSLEELFNGCTKRLNITRKRLAPNGLSLVDDTKTLNIQVKPGWKRGTKITFPKEGDEAPGVTPADVVFVLVEKGHEVRTIHFGLYEQISHCCFPFLCSHL